MVSITYNDLSQHRKAVISALLRLGFFPNAMKYDSAKLGSDVIDSSLEKVKTTNAYIGLISHRCM
jgi:hypothetical protein